ncbi:uncharacterized protein LOC129240551 [Anastrepha obliqua]|uniref:uncharacterized protein LOC129240551 n=1 Tax=Anastrepha obliqua TaxID=95512 RepID=UPI0024095ED6|nr:uncharacterized protein LOC129240551 [Anastrepha obliqua]
MNMQILIISTLIVACSVTQAQPVDKSDAIVEIEKQRLVKFPDEVDPHQDSTGNSSKLDEAQRILQEIEKINHALGYVRKQPEHSRIPPILDSSQYLFPKPAMQPFHQQHHQASGMNGETILIPSIRSISLDQQYVTPYSSSKSIGFRVNPRKHPTTNKSLTKFNEYVFRPNEVILPAPHGSGDQQQIPTHFVIPVRLYKLNKEEYINNNAPQEFRVKGYKIVGDVDHFYGKTKHKNQGVSGGKEKSTPKYNLFFLSREIALNEDSNQNISQASDMKLEAKEESPDSNTREEKVIGNQRPYKIQTIATSSSSSGGSNTNVTTQIIRKRVIPKPFREKEPNISEMTEQQVPFEGISATSSINTNTNTNSKPAVTKSPTHNSNVFNTRIQPGNLNIPNFSNVVRPNDSKNSTASNTIKNAFQNIFKFPFRQDSKPDMTTGVSGQMPPKPFLTTLAYQPVQPPTEVGGAHQSQKGSYYHWDDEASNSASEEEEDNSTEHEEKQIFGNRKNGEQNTQMEAVKQGGIIIQRLKVRKGGIAIAGPGGVATAGSGGTAIVGPGGYALTHPRSLTIAGPGAKVIAIPSSVDLKDALQRTNLSDQSIPREGKVVATGPTVYYSPATGTGTSEDFP